MYDLPQQDAFPDAANHLLTTVATVFSDDKQWKTPAFMRWHEPDDARVSRPDL
jgi:hypothetical protein